MPTCPSCRQRYPDGVATCTADGERLLPDEAFAGADADLAPGQTVGEYKVEEKLGEGGFGAVYRVVHPLIGKTAAVKVLNRQYSSNPQMVSRFIAEARAVNQIRHRNIIDIFSFGSLEDGRQYYLMELLEGMTLDRYVKTRGRIPPEEAIPVLRQIARALDAAHAAGIAHRDLKPENIFLSFDEDSGIFPKLLDFGIAKLLGDSMASHKTRTGTPMGTPNYMSPEQCRGKNVDHRTDVYSFGIVVHEVLTGQLPFLGEDVMDVLFKHTSAPAPPMSSVHPGLSPELDAPVLQMLEKDPLRRPSSLADAIEALAQAANRAGHNVQLARTGDPRGRSGDGAQLAAHSGKGAFTPAELGALSEARTIAQHQQSGKTLLDAEADVRPSGGRRAFVALAAVGFLVGGVALGYSLVSRGGSSPSGQAQGAMPERALGTASAVPSNTDPAPPAGEPTLSAEPAEVEIRIQADPKTFDVFLGTQKIGSGGEPIHLKRGSEKVKLTLKADGYKPADIEITPSESTLVTAKLEKSAPVVNRPKKPSGDLENPF